MRKKDSDLLALHGMALQNVAFLDGEESRRLSELYRNHKKLCIERYGIETAISAELYGWIPPEETD